SGFQSAQFRLIQRVLGKVNLLSVRLFPAEEYWRQYEAAEDRGPASVVDPVILRSDAETADPSTESPLCLVAATDDLAHRVLSRLAPAGAEGTGRAGEGPAGGGGLPARYGVRRGEGKPASGAPWSGPSGSPPSSHPCPAGSPGACTGSPCSDRRGTPRPAA